MIMHEIRPKISVANISFGGSTQSLIAAGYVEDATGFDQITGWKTFRKDGAIQFYVSDDAVVCVACFKQCAIDGISVIGQSQPDVVRELGEPDEIGDAIWVSDERQQIPYEYFALGLQVWFESGRVVSVFCNAAY